MSTLSISEQRLQATLERVHTRGNRALKLSLFCVFVGIVMPILFSGMVPTIDPNQAVEIVVPIVVGFVGGLSTLIYGCIKVNMTLSEVRDEIDNQLWEAIRLGLSDEIPELLQRGVNIEAIGALHFACEKGFDDCVKALLDGGANINAVNRQGETPIILASKKGYHKVVELLLARGAKADIKDKTERTAYDWAILKNQPGSDYISLPPQCSYERWRWVRDERINFPVVIETLKNGFPLHQAIKKGDMKRVRRLLDGGADIEMKDQDRTPLVFALIWGHNEIAKLLLDRGANGYVHTSQGHTHIAEMFVNQNETAYYCDCPQTT